MKMVSYDWHIKNPSELQEAKICFFLAPLQTSCSLRRNFIFITGKTAYLFTELLLYSSGHQLLLFCVGKFEVQCSVIYWG